MAPLNMTLRYIFTFLLFNKIDAWFPPFGSPRYTCSDIWPNEPCFEDDNWDKCANTNNTAHWFPRLSAKEIASVEAAPKDESNSTVEQHLLRRDRRMNAYPPGFGMCCQLPDYCAEHFARINGGHADDAVDCCWQLWSHTCLGYQVDEDYHPDWWNEPPLCNNPKPGYHP